jgi:hypothetical protein
MKNLLRFISAIIIIAATIIVGYTIGKRAGAKESRTTIIENYAFIRDIAELASLEVNGVTSFKSTNISNDDDSWSAGLKKMFLERTVTISLPFTAKYGVDLDDKNMKLVRNGDVLEVHMPRPELLSYELRLDRMEVNNQMGWLQYKDDELYTSFQKKMYAQNRSRLEQDATYLAQAQDRICGILQKYFQPLQVKAVCIFDQQMSMENRKD